MLAMYILADAALLAFFAVERFARYDKDAKKVKKTKYERGSTDFTGAAVVLSILLIFLAPLLGYFRLLDFKSKPVGIIGIVLAAAGIAVRIVGMSTLGRFYTRTLQKTEDHKLVTTGIYRRLRHPGYAGTILIFVGTALAVGNFIVLAAVAALILAAYIYRMNVEEKMLTEIFGEEYTEYKKHSKRILPFLY